MIFWTSDMFATFFVGYHRAGVLVMSPGRIARRYFLTWFVLDFVVNVGDWFGNLSHLLQSSAAAEEDGQAEAQAAAEVLRRILRALRAVRLVRLLKLSRLIAAVQDHINSEITFVLFGILKLLSLLLAINHFIACIWFLLGRAGLDADYPCWVSETEIIDRDIGYRYATSLHWTLTQFTPASMEVFPENVAERSFAVVVLVFALVAFSSFVGSITASMTQLRNMNADRDKQFWLLRRFLKQNAVPQEVSQRLIKYLEYMCQRQSGNVQRIHVKVIGQLSDQLRDELEYHIIIPNCSQHLFFGHCSEHLAVPLRTVCATGMRQQQLASDDMLFYLSDPASHAYFFIQGELIYSRSGFVEEDAVPVEKRECISEATLWVNWQHRGTMRATMESDVIALDSDKFNKVMSKHEDTWQLCSNYARTFLHAYEQHVLAHDINALSDLIRIQDFHVSVLQDACDAAKDHPVRLVTP